MLSKIQVKPAKLSKKDSSSGKQKGADETSKHGSAGPSMSSKAGPVEDPTLQLLQALDSGQTCATCSFALPPQ